MTTNNYSEKQILFIMNKKIEGLSYTEIAVIFNDKFDESKSSQQIKDTFYRHEQDYELPEFDKHPEKVKKEKMDDIIQGFAKFVQKNKYVPTMSDIAELGYSHSTINRYFGSFNELELLIREKFPQTFNKVIDEHSFTDEEFAKLQKQVKKHKTFIITSAVTGCDVHQDGIDAIKNFCKRNDAMMLVLPSSDPASNRKHKWALDYKLKKSSIVFKDLKLNNKLFLSTIKLSAKHINPLTGMDRIAQRLGSCIYASPKQALEYVANKSEKKIPRALMTTGAITKPQYQTSRYMSNRTAYIAEHDHVMGAIIVEIKDNKTFFFRQIQIEPKTGAFIDVDTKYFADGKIKKVKAALVQFGDTHIGETDPMTMKVGREICDVVRPKYLTVEDFFTGMSVNHHNKGRLITRAQNVEHGYYNLTQEFQANADAINQLLSWNNFETLIMKYGNHEDFLFRWLDSRDCFEDAVNYKTAVRLANAVVNEGWENPFAYAMREMYNICKKRVKMLKNADSSFVVGGIENGVHGHLGPNGSRAPGLAGVEKSYGAANVGHTHSAGILRGVFRVGTSSYLKVSYNKGPSSWTQTHLIQHENGSRQLINCINGEWRLKK